MVSENYVYFLLDFIASVNCQTVVFVYISTAVCMESISISSVAYLVYQVEQSSSIDDMNMYSHIVMPSNFNRCFSLFGAAYIRQYCNALEYSHFSAHMAIYRKEKFNQDEWREKRAATMSTESLSLSRRNEEEKLLTKSICRDAKLLFVADFWWKLFVCLLDENNESGRVARQQAKTLCKWIPPTTTEQFFVRKLSRLEIN